MLKWQQERKAREKPKKHLCASVWPPTLRLLFSCLECNTSLTAKVSVKYPLLTLKCSGTQPLHFLKQHCCFLFVCVVFFVCFQAGNHMFFYNMKYSSLFLFFFFFYYHFLLMALLSHIFRISLLFLKVICLLNGMGMSQKYWSSKDRLEEAPGSQTEFSVHYKLYSHKILSTISLKRHFEEVRIILLLKTPHSVSPTRW